MKKLSFCILVLFCILCFSCNDKARNSKILEEAGLLMQTNPDSAFFLLSEIADPSELTDAEKADYGYLTAMFHQREGKAMAEDGMILFSLGYYKDNNVMEKLVTTYALAAQYYRWNEDSQMANTMLRGGLEVALELNDSIIIPLICHEIGNGYYGKKEYGDAISFYRKAIEYDMIESYYMAGLSYAQTGNVDSMHYFMNKAIDIADQRNNNNAANHFRRNYADILIGRKEYNEALTYLNHVANDPENTQQFGVYVSIAQIYLSMRKPDVAQIYIDSARVLFDEIKDTRSEVMNITSDNIIMALQVVADYAKGGAVSMHPIGRGNDVYRTKATENELIIEEKINVKNRLEQRNLILAIGKQRMLLYITWGSVFLVVIIILAFLYIRRKRSKFIEAEEKREVLEKLLKEATAANEKDNAFFKKVLLQQLGLIKIVASTPTGHNQELLKQVSNINNRNIPADDMLVWDDLYKLTDSIYNGFYTKLSSKYGEILTEKEKQLACLLCAGFSTKEISVISQQGIQTIYQRKTTIRQKLKMDEKEDIVDFILS